MTETGEMTESKRVEMCRKLLKLDKLDSRFCGNDGILDFCFRVNGWVKSRPNPKKRRFQTASKTAGTMPAVCCLRFRGAGGLRPSRVFPPVRT